MLYLKFTETLVFFLAKISWVKAPRTELKSLIFLFHPIVWKLWEHIKAELTSKPQTLTVSSYYCHGHFTLTATHLTELLTRVHSSAAHLPIPNYQNYSLNKPVRRTSRFVQFQDLSFSYSLLPELYLVLQDFSGFWH